MFELFQGDCLELMNQIPDGSVDMILCDLPYGTTACKWDTVIPFEPLWEQYKRVTKPNAAIVLTASQPFTSALVMSNLEMFKYEWIWEKDSAANFLNFKYQAGKVHENILVFSKTAASYSKKGTMNYFPQMTQGKPYAQKSGKQKTDANNASVRSKIDQVVTENKSGDRYPKSILRQPSTILRYNRDIYKLHQTQKPVGLMEYLIRTYTNEGETVLDNCLGSGTTGVACMNTGRRFIGIEKDEKYFQIAEKRISEALFESVGI